MSSTAPRRPPAARLPHRSVPSSKHPAGAGIHDEHPLNPMLTMPLSPGGAPRQPRHPSASPAAGSLPPHHQLPPPPPPPEPVDRPQNPPPRDHPLLHPV